MPRPVSASVLQAKRLGNSFNLVHVQSDTPLFLTDNNIPFEYLGNTYLANGLLQSVDPGALTAGIAANDWEVQLSGVLDEMYSGFLSQNLRNRWVYHYVAYFQETPLGITVVGVENKKFGQILSHTDRDDESSADITLTMTGPLGNVDRANELKTNVISHQRRFPGDFFFRYAHETDFKVSKSNTGTNGLVGRAEGTKISEFVPNSL